MKRRREQFQKTIDEGYRAQAKSGQSALRQMQQAEVPATVLVNSESWGYFQSILQADIEGLGRVLSALQGSALGDSSFDAGPMAAHKALQMQVKAQMDTLVEVLALPKRIIEQGEKAALALQDYTDQ